MNSTQIRQFISQSSVLGQLSKTSFDELVQAASVFSLEQGQTLLRNRVLKRMSLVQSGTLRLLAEHPFKPELFTVGFANPGDLVGFIVY